jgi:hypothetical protein
VGARGCNAPGYPTAIRAVLDCVHHLLRWVNDTSDEAGREKIALMQERDDDLVTLDMSARIWAGIDAGVDNAMSLAAPNGDEATVQMGQRIRQAGWDQVPWVKGGWPPMDQVISIRLSRAEWTFAADEARHSIPIYEELGDEVSARLGRDALAVIESDHR